MTNDNSQVISRMVNQMDMRNFVPGSSHTVEVTHINHPKDFYVRLASMAFEVKLLETPGDPITQEDLTISKRVIFKSGILNKYVRGDVELISSEETQVTCTIFAVDYGCRETQIPISCIYLPDSDVYCPPLALHCELYMCEPIGATFQPDVIDTMKYYIGEYNAQIKIKLQVLDKFTVVLRTFECPDDIGFTLALLNYTQMMLVSNEVNRFHGASSPPEINKFKSPPLNVGNRFIVRVQSGDSINSFYVAELDDYKKYVKQAKDFSLCCKSEPVQDVDAAAADGRPCGVRVNAAIQYERAIVIKVTDPGAKALVKLVDWGKQIEVNYIGIKQVNTSRFTELPAIAIHCSSDEKQMWKTSLPKFFYPGYEFVIEIVELGDGDSKPYKVNIIPMPTKK